MAHQNVFRTREGGGSKTSCNPKPTDQHYVQYVHYTRTHIQYTHTPVQYENNEKIL